MQRRIRFKKERPRHVNYLADDDIGHVEVAKVLGATSEQWGELRDDAFSLIGAFGVKTGAESGSGEIVAGGWSLGC